MNKVHGVELRPNLPAEVRGFVRDHRGWNIPDGFREPVDATDNGRFLTDDLDDLAMKIVSFAVMLLYQRLCFRRFSTIQSQRFWPGHRTIPVVAE